MFVCEWAARGEGILTGAFVRDLGRSEEMPHNYVGSECHDWRCNEAWGWQCADCGHYFSRSEVKEDKASGDFYCRTRHIADALSETVDTAERNRRDG